MEFLSKIMSLKIENVNERIHAFMKNADVFNSSTSNKSCMCFCSKTRLSTGVRNL